jgi:selenocysteine lyase/cysteine desulfurase
VNRFDISWVGDTDGFEIDSKELKRQLLSGRIDILAISHVQWLTAFKIDVLDIGQFCSEHDITFILDTTQSLGAVPVHLSSHPIDVLICSNYKWMNAGFGTGIMYLSESFMRKYPPVVAGSNSYSYATGTFNFEPSIMNFEPGHLNMPGLLILEKAIEQKLQQGIENIALHNLRLLQLLVDRIEPSLVLGTREMQQRSSIVMLKDPGHLFDRLTNSGVVAIKRGANIRISIHFYNTENEVRQLIQLLQP